MNRANSHERAGGHHGEARKEGVNEDIRRQDSHAIHAHKKAEVGTQTAGRHERLTANPAFDPEANLKRVLREIPKEQLSSMDAGEKLKAQGYEERNIPGVKGVALRTLINKGGGLPKNGVTGFVTAETYRYDDVRVACNGQRDPETGDRLFTVYVKGKKSA